MQEVQPRKSRRREKSRRESSRKGRLKKDKGETRDHLRRNGGASWIDGTDEKKSRGRYRVWGMRRVTNREISSEKIQAKHSGGPKYKSDEGNNRGRGRIRSRKTKKEGSGLRLDWELKERPESQRENWGQHAENAQ